MLSGQSGSEKASHECMLTLYCVTWSTHTPAPPFCWRECAEPSNWIMYSTAMLSIPSIRISPGVKSHNACSWIWRLPQVAHWMTSNEAVGVWVGEKWYWNLRRLSLGSCGSKVAMTWPLDEGPVVMSACLGRRRDLSLGNVRSDNCCWRKAEIRMCGGLWTQFAGIFSWHATVDSLSELGGIL